ncbi:hypothetical protein [Kurthia sp. Dielmo]|uniref:hypothetical protein n=1 Tax=Kurthia sp. Dielmo TaxID=1033738 RepID=UPI0002F7670C|nr:hypothetical protein [Kurthia sp. Dielmo]
MLKIRLHGELKDIESFIQKLNKQKELRVLQQSVPYKDRGKSFYHRVYLDVEEREG